jgi:uncharacterized protein YdaU (DUF1376 family)
MGKLKWYKRWTDAALVGMSDLSLEERGAYNTILDLIYNLANRLYNDDREIAEYMHCDMRTWKTIKPKLIAKGKLYISKDNRICNGRADIETGKTLRKDQPRSGVEIAKTGQTTKNTTLKKDLPNISRDVAQHVAPHTIENIGKSRGRRKKKESPLPSYRETATPPATLTGAASPTETSKAEAIRRILATPLPGIPEETLGQRIPAFKNSTGIDVEQLFADYEHDRKLIEDPP